MRFASVCDGIGAAVLAFSSLGWEGVWRSEIEPYCESVARFRYPLIPNLGDMTAITDAQLDAAGPIDVLVGGTPCQSFSVAGLRRGLDDDRGKLSVEFIELARRTEAKYVVWENVPGVLSDRSDAFGCFLAGLVGCRERSGEGVDGWRWHDAGRVDGPEGSAVWRILDAQYFGVAQRRRRVFVVFCPRAAGVDPAEVLFEREGVRRDSPPSREAGAGASALTACGVGTCGAYDNQAQQGHLVAHTLRAEGHVASRDGTGRGTPLVPDVAPAITAKMAKGTGGPSGDECQNLIAYSIRSDATREGIAKTPSPDGTGRFSIRHPGMGVTKELSPTLDCGQAHIVAYGSPLETTGKQGDRVVGAGDIWPCLSAAGANNGGGAGALLHKYMSVRRLTPRECERLQGFPDGWTDVPHKGRPASDTARYRALGNSMAVPVMRWIGGRIERVERGASS